MNQVLNDFINTIKTDRRINSYDEAATKQGIILRILSALQWDTFNIDEVKPEYSMNGKRVDYSLRINGQNKVFIEVKKIGIDLENHQEQLLNYSFKEGVKLSILTNGITWWLYLPLHEGSWEQRKFYTIDLLQQNTDDIINKLYDFLLKENIINGKAVKNAEDIYHGQQKFNVLNDSIPKAWNKLIEQKDDLLIELINDFTEKLCGFKADYEMIENFLNANKNQFIVYSNINKPSNCMNHITPQNDYQPINNSNFSETISGINDYTGKNPFSFWFKNNKFDVKSWKDILIKLSTFLCSNNYSNFEKSLKLTGRRRPYYSKNPNELRSPYKIDKSDIFVETNLSANNIIKICNDLINILGHSENDFKIEMR